VIRIAYMAPEIPALSATFVYEELLALERRGFTVLPLSVHHPAESARGQEHLSGRCITVYDSPKWRVALSGFWRLPVLPGLRSALGWLIEDFHSVGLSDTAVKLLFHFLAGAKVAYIMRRSEVSHLHIHFAHVPTQIGMYAAALSGIPFTVMAHANDIFERGNLLGAKARRSKKFLTISEFNKTYLLNKGVAALDIAVVRCGVSFPMLERRLTFEFSGRPRIGTLGRLVEKKGMDVLLRAVALLRDLGQDLELIIAGTGPLRSKLEAMVDELKLKNSVRFDGGLAHHEVLPWLHRLDLFVLACKSDSNGDMDGIPVVLMEAMSQRVPVISTRLSGIPELVIDGQTGLLAQPGDEFDLAEKLLAMLRSTETRTRFAMAGEQHVRTEFGQDVNLDRLISHIDRQ
jgi:colanic acid/amylovoran biosynthesis glycosyltransferase